LEQFLKILNKLLSIFSKTVSRLGHFDSKSQSNHKNQISINFDSKSIPKSINSPLIAQSTAHRNSKKLASKAATNVYKDRLLASNPPIDFNAFIVSMRNEKRINFSLFSFY
jgi:hypothetical protein